MAGADLLTLDTSIAVLWLEMRQPIEGSFHGFPEEMNVAGLVTA
jgi:hypothetical protein